MKATGATAPTARLPRMSKNRLESRRPGTKSSESTRWWSPRRRPASCRRPADAEKAGQTRRFPRLCRQAGELACRSRISLQVQGEPGFREGLGTWPRAAGSPPNSTSTFPAPAGLSLRDAAVKKIGKSRKEAVYGNHAPETAARLRRFARTRLRRFPPPPEKSSAGLRPPGRKCPRKTRAVRKSERKGRAVSSGWTKSPRRRKTSFRPLVSVFPPPFPA